MVPIYDIDVEKSNAAEGQLGKQDADDVVVEESDSEVRESHHESPSLSSANQRAVASQVCLPFAMRKSHHWLCVRHTTS
jgi:hypothetical protein